MSLDEALEHPFLKSNDTPTISGPGTNEWLEIAQSLKSYWSMCKFNQVLCKAVAFSLKPNQISDLRSIFTKIDTDRNGCVSMNELKTILHEQCGDYAAEIEQSEEFQALSRDNAEISYSDFIAAALVKRVCLDESQLKMTFERLDEDRAGHLNCDNIRHAVGDKMTPDEVKDMMIALDNDGNGEIDYHEFLRHWRKLTIKKDKQPSEPCKKFRKLVNMVKAVNRFKSVPKPSIGGFSIPKQEHVKQSDCESDDYDRLMDVSHGTSGNVLLKRSLSSNLRGRSFYDCINASPAEIEVKSYFERVASITYDDDADDHLLVGSTSSSSHSNKFSTLGKRKFDESCTPVNEDTRSKHVSFAS